MIVLINPNLTVLQKDIFTTGIVYMPIGLAYLAAKLKTENIGFKVIDAFIEGSGQIRKENGFYVQGLTPNEVVERLPPDTEMVFIYANILISHTAVLSIVRAVKTKDKAILVAIVENSQAVSAYSLKETREEFIVCGADYLVTGDGEEVIAELFRNRKNRTGKDDNCLAGEAGKLDSLPFPAWEYFPLEKYWNLGYAHGPLQTGRYLPLLTSRGCPNNCNFCVAPATNKSNWRFRSAENVVSEIERQCKKHNVREFHIEDLNPTVSEERITRICELLIAKKLNIVWKIVSGTKAETITKRDTLKLMKEAGCNYISISPESGSEKVMRAINKGFDIEHGLWLVNEMHTLGIYSQVCFVLGFPGEEELDLTLTRKLMKKFIKTGADEAAVFIIAPVPGSKIYQNLKGYISLSELTFSPVWRKDYKALNTFRMKLYALYFLLKIIYHPLKTLEMFIFFIRRNFHTKMEMAAFRGIKFMFCLMRNRL